MPDQGAQLNRSKLVLILLSKVNAQDDDMGCGIRDRHPFGFGYRDHTGKQKTFQTIVRISYIL